MDSKQNLQTMSPFNNQKYLKNVIDVFSNATGLSVAASNMDGEIYLASANYEKVEFCRYIKNCTENGCERCQSTYKKACHEALRWKEPYFFICHAGLVMWVVPVIINTTPIGAMICGQVLLWEPDELFFDDLRQYHPMLDESDFQRLKKETQKINVISVNQCQSAANLLSVTIQYMANTLDINFVEQKGLQDWRNEILTRLESQKEKHAAEEFDMSVYFRRERRFLQYLRMLNKTQADKIIPLLFTDIEILGEHNITNIKRMLGELMTVSSRALVEAGIDINILTTLTKEHWDGMKEYTHSDKLFYYTYQVFNRMLESSYLLIQSQEHTSIIKSVRKYIDTHYNEHITINDIAARVSMSSSYLSSLFKNKMGMTVHDYLLRVRIEKSIELMSHRELSIKQIMQQCGIESQSYYNRIFKKMIGLTPGKYRNQLL